MPRLLDLDAPAARDERRAGGKAAALSRARGAGLPALPGAVVPVGEAAAAFEAAAAALSGGGSGAARLALMDAPLDAPLLAELADRGAALGPRLVARSSSPLEAEGTWAGAFTSYTDAGPDDLPVVVRGCWASAFNRDVLERWQAAGLQASQLAMAVLIQPALALDAGGLATVDAEGNVTVVGVAGAPDALMAGWARGERMLVRPDGAAESGDDGSLNTALAGRVAALSRDVLERLGLASIEWGRCDGALHLLQAQRGVGTAAPGDSAATIDEAYASPAARRVAAHVLAAHGPLGDAMVLPWSLALPSPRALPETTPTSDPPAALERVRAMASDLIARTWRRPAPEGARAAAALLQELSGPAPARALRRLDDLRPLGAAAGDDLLAEFAALAGGLAAGGLLPHTAALWRLTPDGLEAMVARGAVPNASEGPSVDRWRWFLHATARAQGEGTAGTPAAGGRGAGRLCRLAAETDATRFRDGDVIAARYPLNWMAPLLWRAGGLVTSDGSPAAHLIEVARWLKVPAVVHCALPDTALRDALVAVDGDAGAVSVLPVALRPA